MLELMAIWPLAQMNSSTTGAAATAGSPTPSTVVGPAAATAPEVVTTSNAITSTSGAPTTGKAADTQPATSNPIYTFIIMAVVLGGLYFFMTRGQRKDEKKRKDMMADLKKGDRVMTIGGMLASVVSVDDDKVVLKIDESNNIKATYRKTAIQEVIDRDEKKA